MTDRIEAVETALHESMVQQDVNGYLDAKIDAGLLARAAIAAYQQSVASEAVAWMHTMHMEHGNKKKTVNFREKDPFGRRGHDYDPTYTVTSEPLFRAASREAER